MNKGKKLFSIHKIEDLLNVENKYFIKKKLLVDGCELWTSVNLEAFGLLESDFDNSDKVSIYLKDIINIYPETAYAFYYSCDIEDDNPYYKVTDCNLYLEDCIPYFKDFIIFQDKLINLNTVNWCLKNNIVKVINYLPANKNELAGFKYSAESILSPFKHSEIRLGTGAFECNANNDKFILIGKSTLLKIPNDIYDKLSIIDSISVSIRKYYQTNKGLEYSKNFDIYEYVSNNNEHRWVLIAGFISDVFGIVKSEDTGLYKSDIIFNISSKYPGYDNCELCVGINNDINNTITPLDALLMFIKNSK